MSNTPHRIPEEYLYSLDKPSAPPPKKRGWTIAVAVILLFLLCLCALLLPLREAAPPMESETSARETATESLGETHGDSHVTEAPEETETVDMYGLYEGGEVMIGVSGYSPDFPEGDHGYRKSSFEYDLDYSEKIGYGQKIADDEAPATRQLAATGDLPEQALYYQGSYGRYYADGQAYYRLYADESGWYTYLFTVDGRLVEYDMPADGIEPFEDDAQAIRVALDFLRSVGVEITDEYTCTVTDPSEPHFFDTDPKEGRASKVFVTRNIGGMIGEGYVVYCGMSVDTPAVIYSRIINEGMYEAFGYITEEQVEHTRRRLYEAIGLLEPQHCDSYEINSYRKERLILSDGHLYLRVWITPVDVDPQYYGDVGGGICEMRVDP